MFDARYTYTAGIPAHRVGALVARARVASSLTDRTLADRLRVRLRTVRDWERGQIVPSDDQIEAIAQACGIRITELLPRREALTFDVASGVLRLGAAATTLPLTMRTNEDVLVAFLTLVRQERGVRPDREVSVRSDDLDALAEALDLDDEELEEGFMGVVGLTRRQAAEVRAQLLRRRLTVGVVAMIAGIGLVTAQRAFSTGEVHVSAGEGGRLVRGDPFVRPTTVVSVAPDLTASSTITIATAPSSTTAATMPAATTAVGSPLPPPTPPPTLPPVVLAAEVELPAGQDGRTGPPRSTPRPEVGPPATHPADPVTEPGTTPTTVVQPGPPTLPPPVTTLSPPASSTPVTTTGSLPPPPPPTTPVTTTGSLPPPPPPTTPTPVVSTIGGGGTTGTTEPPPPTTTTTEPPPPTTTTTTAPPPTTTTTTEPATTTTTTTTTP